MTILNPGTAADRQEIISRLYVSALALFVALSGYTFTSIAGNALQQNFAARALAMLLLAAMSAGVWLLPTHRIAIPVLALLLAAPILYLLGIALARGHTSEWIAPGIRWVTYFSVMVGFFNLRNSEHHLRLFTTVLGWALVIQVLVDLVSGRGLELNSAFRVGGSVGSAIGMAAALGACGLTSYYLWAAHRHLSSLALSVACGAAMIPTGTRSVLVGYALLIPLITILASRGSRRLLALFVGGVLTSVVAYVILSFTQVGQRLLFRSLAEDSSTAFRVRILESLGQFDGHDRLLGTGLGGFPTWFKGVTGLDGVAPHFELVWIYVEGGVLGSALYAITTAAALLLSLRSSPGQPARIHAVFACVLILAPQGLFQFANPTYFFQAMIPMFAAIGTIAAVQSTRPFRNDAPPPSWRHNAA